MQSKLTELFAGVEDSRNENMCSHKLKDMLFIALSTLICNGEDFEGMDLFANKMSHGLKSF